MELTIIFLGLCTIDPTFGDHRIDFRTTPPGVWSMLGNWVDNSLEDTAVDSSVNSEKYTTELIPWDWLNFDLDNIFEDTESGKNWFICGGMITDWNSAIELISDWKVRIFATDGPDLPKHTEVSTVDKTSHPAAIWPKEYPPVRSRLPSVISTPSHDSSSYSLTAPKTGIYLRDREMQSSSDVFRASNMLLEAVFVFWGTFCKTESQVKSMTAAFVRWDRVFSSPSYDNSKWKIREVTCHDNPYKDRFTLIATFQEAREHPKSFMLPSQTDILEELIRDLNTKADDIRFLSRATITVSADKKRSSLFRLIKTRTRTKPDCPPGSKRKDTEMCVWCPVGYFEREGACWECTQGTYQDEPGQTSCKLCDQASDQGRDQDSGQSIGQGGRSSCALDVSVVVAKVYGSTITVIAAVIGVILSLAVVGYCLVRWKSNKVVRIHLTTDNRVGGLPTGSGVAPTYYGREIVAAGKPAPRYGLPAYPVTTCPDYTDPTYHIGKEQYGGCMTAVEN